MFFIEYFNRQFFYLWLNYLIRYKIIDMRKAIFFSIISILRNNVDWMNADKILYQTSAFIDINTGELKATLSTSKYSPFGILSYPEVHTRLKISSQGFAFIPVHSAIDFDYYKTLNISTDYNLLQHYVQDFLLAHSPFHVISGFNYDYKNYPDSANAAYNNINWSHGYFTNTRIEDGKDDKYLCREIGDSIIYINNLNLGIRNADFQFQDVQAGVQNPNYIYDNLVANRNKISFVYSKKNSFKFKEPGLVTIKFNQNFIVGEDIQNEGSIINKKVDFKPCGIVHKKISKPFVNDTEIRVYPNPFNKSVQIENIYCGNSFEIIIFNTIGQVVYKTIFEKNANDEIFELDTQDLQENTLYFMIIKQNNNVLHSDKLIKIK